MVYLPMLSMHEDYINVYWMRKALLCSLAVLRHCADLAILGQHWGLGMCAPQSLRSGAQSSSQSVYCF